MMVEVKVECRRNEDGQTMKGYEGDGKWIG